MFGEVTYLLFLLGWAGPVLVLHWLAGGPELRKRWRALALATLLSTLYLSAADRFALGSGIWRISPDRSLGVFLFGLPLEEFLFFLITNLMVAQSIVLLATPELNLRVVRGRLASGCRGGTACYSRWLRLASRGLRCARHRPPYLAKR